MGKLKLTVNQEKTPICKVPEGEFKGRRIEQRATKKNEPSQHAVVLGAHEGPSPVPKRPRSWASRLLQHEVRSSGAQLQEVGRLLDDGTIRVVLDSTYPLADARKAHERAAKGRYDASANQKQLLLPRTQFADDGPAMIADIAASDRVCAASSRTASICCRHCT